MNAALLWAKPNLFDIQLLLFQRRTEGLWKFEKGILKLLIYNYGNNSKLERVLIECRKTKTKVITLANEKGRRQSSEPIKTQSNFT